ncbi:MAG: helix-turn-helix transcriptional regulator [Caulobacteraceae bacterium]
MARRGRKNSRKRSRGDPGQLGLFDPIEPAPVRGAAQPAAQPKPARRIRTRAPDAAAASRPVVLDARQAAQYLGVSVSTLKSWRAKKIGPRWTMRGARLIGYRPADLEHFLDENSENR